MSGSAPKLPETVPRRDLHGYSSKGPIAAPISAVCPGRCDFTDDTGLELRSSGTSDLESQIYLMPRSLEDGLHLHLLCHVTSLPG